MKTKVNRKGFLKWFIIGASAPFAILPAASYLKKRFLKRFLRPPGAITGNDFYDACIACGQCAAVCPNKCISYYGLESDLNKLGTPYIDARAKGCILCMACNNVCPTSALEKLPATKEGMKQAEMGLAKVSEDYCFSYAGRTCGVCYQACPLQGEAMTVGLFETPIVHEEFCVGCGLCEQACVHMPQAIRVTPIEDLIS